MYAQQAPLLAPRPSLSAALTSTETRPCPCCPTFPFIYNRWIGGYIITLILQWLSLIFLIAGTATPAFFLYVANGYTFTFGLFHACLVYGTSRTCQPYEGSYRGLLGTSHQGQQWSAFQALTVTLNVLSFAVAVLYTMRLVVVQRRRTLSKRAEIGLFGFSSVTLLLAFISVILFLNCYSNVSPNDLSVSSTPVKTLGSSFTLVIAAYLMQMIALFLQSYTYMQQARAMRLPGAASATPVRDDEPEPVAMGLVANQHYPSAYTPAAAAAYQQQPAFYGQAYQLPQQYMQPAQGGVVPSYYSPPQYYAPPQQMPTYTQQYQPPSAQPYPYGEQQQQQQPASHPPQ